MSEDDFECESCRVMFSAPLYDISRSSEKMIDTPDEPYPFLVDIRGAMGFANFCSSACRDKGRVAAMAAQGVPIPTERPVYDPVESCAICNGAVDMHEWHLTYTESACDENWKAIEDVEYMAVVCPTCESKRASTR